MNTPTILSEQEIISAGEAAGLNVDSPALQKCLRVFTGAIEAKAIAAYAAKLAEGVELEAHLYEFPTEEASFQVYAHCYEGKNPPANAIALVPLSTAQAAVAAERVKAEKWERAGALGDVLEERRRQAGTLGWTAQHDDEHSNGELAIAAAAYADPAPAMYRDPRIIAPLRFPPGWDYKPKDYRTNLVRAAALLVAEIERVDRGGPIPPHLLIYRERIRMSDARKAEIAREKAEFEADCARIPTPKDKP